MGGARGTYGGEYIYIHGLLRNRKGRDHKEDQGIDESIIIKMDLKKQNETGMEWIYLAQDRNKWRLLWAR